MLYLGEAPETLAEDFKHLGIVEVWDTDKFKSGNLATIADQFRELFGDLQRHVDRCIDAKMVDIFVVKELVELWDRLWADLVLLVNYCVESFLPQES